MGFYVYLIYAEEVEGSHVLLASTVISYVTIMRYTLQAGVAGAQPPGGHEVQRLQRRVMDIVEVHSNTYWWFTLVRMIPEELITMKTSNKIIGGKSK